MLTKKWYVQQITGYLKLWSEQTDNEFIRDLANCKESYACLARLNKTILQKLWTYLKEDIEMHY